jgi:hypothetical protein
MVLVDVAEIIFQPNRRNDTGTQNTHTHTQTHFRVKKTTTQMTIGIQKLQIPNQKRRRVHPSV